VIGQLSKHGALGEGISAFSVCMTKETISCSKQRRHATHTCNLAMALLLLGETPEGNRERELVGGFFFWVCVC
jgi:hypothetical protein